MSERIRKWPASTALAGVWLVAAAVTEHTTYGFWTVLVIAVGVLVVLGSVLAGIEHAPPATSVVVALTVATPVLLLVTPLFINVNRTHWLVPAVVAGATVVLLGLLPLRAARPWVVWLPLGATAVVFGGIILGGTPRIDVWVILQQVAGGLWHHNPYDLRFPGVPGGETDCCFNYLPSTFLLTAPSAWLFGDVRWIEAACVVAAGALLVWQVGRRGRWSSGRELTLALLVVGLPGTLLVVQQAWTEPMLLIALVGAAVAVDRGRWWWAVLAVGVALANKQHAVVLVPFLLLYRDFGVRRTLGASAVGAAIMLPWVVADPARFTFDVGGFYLDETAPGASVSVWRWLPDGWSTPILLIGTAAVTWLAVRRGPRGGAGLLFGCGLVLLTFDLLNKQTFLNQWWLAVALVVAGLALRPVDQVARMSAVTGRVATYAARERPAARNGSAERRARARVKVPSSVVSTARISARASDSARPRAVK